MTDKPQLYGWYSQNAVNAGGPVFLYTSPNGEVEVTYVTRSPEVTYGWKDKRSVGPVGTMVSQVVRPRSFAD